MTLRRARGLTLLELMIALTASAIVIAGAVGAAIAQQAAFLRSAQIRAAQSSARAAQLFLQEKLRLAGFGMDPALALDFRVYTPGNYASFPCPAESGGCARDATDNSDELVFYARNPNYWVPNALWVPTGGVPDPVGRAWRILGVAAPDSAAAITTTGVAIQAHAGDTFPAGQILAAVCPGGRYYTYMTVRANTTFAAAGPATVPLAAVDTTNPFRRQDLAVAPGSDTPVYFTATGALANPVTPSSCFSSGQARLFEIDRYRFHVRPVAVGSGGGRTQYDPYLVLDMGVDTNLDGRINADDEFIIAEGIEIMQVAYVLSNAALPTPTPGMTAGTAIALVAGLPGSATTADEITTTQLAPTLPLAFSNAPQLARVENPYAAASWYSYSLTQPFPAGYPRLTDHQGNVRAVRIALLARSPEPDTQALPNVVLDATFRLYNLDTVPAWITANAFPDVARDGFQRIVAETSVLLPNMTARGMSFF